MTVITERNTIPMYRSPRQIARDLDISEPTVYRWLRSGELRSIRPGGRLYRIAESDYLDFKASRA